LIHNPEGLSYAAAGVDIEAYEKALAKVRPVIEATGGRIGQFAGLYEMPGLGHLVASADGVGTKIKVAIALGSHHGIGVDVVNHCLNDIAVLRARPLFFVDYFATGKLEPAVFEAVVAGMSLACREAGMPLLGGETAEMPGMYALGDYDVAGFIVGMVPRGELPDPTAVKPGDALVGLPSSGLHTNGFSLVRRVFEGRALPAEVLTPHRSYLDALRSFRWKTAAHITGGGIPGNLPRALPPGLSYRLNRDAWEAPAIFEEISRAGRLSEEEMFRTFNMGIGLVAVCARADAPAEFPVIGEVVHEA
jgi:phosphoribosylformylglycinamidine cyclo-ligase